MYNSVNESNSNNNTGLYFHKVETPQSNDVLVWKQDRRKQATRADFSGDYRLLILETYEETDPPSKNLYFCAINDDDQDYENKFQNLSPSLIESQDQDGLYSCMYSVFLFLLIIGDFSYLF